MVEQSKKKKKKKWNTLTSENPSEIEDNHFNFCDKIKHEKES